MLGKNLITAAAGAGGEVLGVEDVFSTWLYTGNGSTQTITNGIDLSGEGGLVWIKRRDSTPDHHLYDTARPIGRYLSSNNTNSQGGDSFYGVTSYTNSGFVLSGGFEAPFNFLNGTYASWTFRKAEKFFDVVTYTGTGSNRTIAHNLGSVPGCIIVKKLDSTGGDESWAVYHRSTTATNELRLNSTLAAFASSTAWNDTEPTSSVFTVGTGSRVNLSGSTYVAYLFAHDAGGFGDDGTESVIKCGSFTSNASFSASVTLGWEPQWLLIKRTDSTGDWAILDTMRGVAVGVTNLTLVPNSSDVEGGLINYNSTFNSTGFSFNGSLPTTTASYIYIAIRRGLMKTPTDATTVFNLTAYTGNATANTTIAGSAGFPVDHIVLSDRDATSTNWGISYAHYFVSKILGTKTLATAFTSAEVGGWGGYYAFDVNNDIGWGLYGGSSGTAFMNKSGTKYVAYKFRRAPGFFDVVTYTGTGSSTTVSHNLGVAPELMIVKVRSTTYGWNVWSKDIGSSDYMELHSNFGASAGSTYFNSTAPTSSVFTVGTAFGTNRSAFPYIAYLFATCPGVSKVGSYTGTGTTLNVDCGFTAGARFVLIKRTDSTGDWYVWDTARGIVSGNDPYLRLNSAAAEVTSTDYIDPLSSGFQISSTAPAEINANGGSYIFLAIA